MLSIQFQDGREWWVSGRVFERLFRAAVDDGLLAPELDEWRYVADASGGLDLGLLDSNSAGRLDAGLRAAAARELSKLVAVDPDSPDGAYRVGLLQLVGDPE